MNYLRLILRHHSLPSIAYQAMFQNIPSHLPFGFSFDNQRDHIRQWFRSNLIGGLSSVFHRHLDLSGEENSPFAARHTPDGAKLTYAEFVDFTGDVFSNVFTEISWVCAKRLENLFDLHIFNTLMVGFEREAKINRSISKMAVICYFSSLEDLIR